MQTPTRKRSIANKSHQVFTRKMVLAKLLKQLGNFSLQTSELNLLTLWPTYPDPPNLCRVGRWASVLGPLRCLNSGLYSLFSQERRTLSQSLRSWKNLDRVYFIPLSLDPDRFPFPCPRNTSMFYCRDGVGLEPGFIRQGNLVFFPQSRGSYSFGVFFVIDFFDFRHILLRRSLSDRINCTDGSRLLRPFSSVWSNAQLWDASWSFQTYSVTDRWRQTALSGTSSATQRFCNFLPICALIQPWPWASGSSFDPAFTNTKAPESKIR